MSRRGGAGLVASVLLLAGCGPGSDGSTADDRAPDEGEVCYPVAHEDVGPECSAELCVTAPIRFELESGTPEDTLVPGISRSFRVEHADGGWANVSFSSELPDAPTTDEARAAFEYASVVYRVPDPAIPGTDFRAEPAVRQGMADITDLFVQDGWLEVEWTQRVHLFTHQALGDLGGAEGSNFCYFDTNVDLTTHVRFKVES